MGPISNADVKFPARADNTGFSLAKRRAVPGSIPVSGVVPGVPPGTSTINHQLRPEAAPHSSVSMFVAKMLPSG